MHSWGFRLYDLICIHVETIDFTTSGKTDFAICLFIGCSFALCGGMWSCTEDIFHWIMYYIRNIIIIFPVDLITLFLYVCICLLNTVVCMHHLQPAHIFIVQNSVQYVRYL